MKHEFHIGENALIQLQHLLSKLHIRHIFLVRGKNSYIQSGAANELSFVWDYLGCKISEFYDFSANPKEEELQQGIKSFHAVNADCIIAVGGGSAIDMAKLIRYHSQGGSANQIPLFAIPTTAGTGAEATRFAVLYKDGVKHSIEHESILPTYAIIYPPFTYNNPPYLTACTGLDALAQAIEAFWNKNATSESKSYAIKAIQLLWEQLPLLIQSATPQLRNKVAEGAYWAGRAINITKTTAPHAYSYAFTSDYGYPHGHAVALTLPFFIALNGNNELYKLLQIDSRNCVQDMIAYLKQLNLDCNLTHVNIDNILQKVNTQRLSNNPILITNKIVQQLRDYLTSTK
jgi:alcohol dehydrogenase class IV